MHCCNMGGKGVKTMGQENVTPSENTLESANDLLLTVGNHSGLFWEPKWVAMIRKALMRFKCESSRLTHKVWSDWMVGKTLEAYRCLDTTAVCSLLEDYSCLPHMLAISNN